MRVLRSLFIKECSGTNLPTLPIPGEFMLRPKTPYSGTSRLFEWATRRNMWEIYLDRSSNVRFEMFDSPKTFRKKIISANIHRDWCPRLWLDKDRSTSYSHSHASDCQPVNHNASKVQLRTNVSQKKHEKIEKRRFYEKSKKKWKFSGKITFFLRFSTSEDYTGSSRGTFECVFEGFDTEYIDFWAQGCSTVAHCFQSCANKNPGLLKK